MNYTVVIDWKFAVALAAQLLASSSQRRWTQQRLKRCQSMRLTLSRSMQSPLAAAANPSRMSGRTVFGLCAFFIVGHPVRCVGDF